MRKITAQTVRERVSEYALRLGEELQELSGNPRLGEIVGGHYLYDGELKPPSKDIIAAVAFFLLQSLELKEKLENLGEDEGLLLVAEKLATLSLPETSSLALNQARLIVRESLWYGDDKQATSKAILFNLIEVFNSATTGIDRSISEGAITRLVSLALFERDHAFLHSLAEVSEESNGARMKPLKTKYRILIAILLYAPLLKAKLGKQPTKSETKEFALLAWEGLSDDPTTWSQAFRDAGINFPEDRSGQRLNKDGRATLHRLAKELG